MRNYFKLFAISFGLYVFFAHFTPFVASFVPAWQAYYESCHEHNIDPSALYYTDLEEPLAAERQNRISIEETMGSLSSWKPVEK